MSFERGLRAAIDSTRALVAAGGREPIFEATFDHDGVSARIDVLDRSEPQPKLIEVKSSAHVKEHYLDDCAVQAWALAENGLDAAAGRRRDARHRNGSTQGDGSYDGLLVETRRDRARCASGSPAVPGWVRDARRTLADLDEPAVAVGVHCGAPHGCEFYAHCAPPAGKYSVLGLGGSKENLFELMHAGYRDLRDVPEAELKNDTQRLHLAAVAARGSRIVGAELQDAGARAAVPALLLGLRDDRRRPCRSSRARGRSRRCRSNGRATSRRSRGALEHAEFLELGAEPPMRRARRAACSRRSARAGPIVVYTPYERRVLHELAARYPDLAARLTAARRAHRRSASGRRAATTTTPRCRARGRSRPCCRRSRRT